VSGGNVVDAVSIPESQRNSHNISFRRDDEMEAAPDENEVFSSARFRLYILLDSYM
jgi:hypothetical protein